MCYDVRSSDLKLAGAYARAAAVAVLSAILGAGAGSPTFIGFMPFKALDFELHAGGGKHVYMIPATRECDSNAARLCAKFMRHCVLDGGNEHCTLQCLAASPPALDDACLRSHPCAAAAESLCADVHARDMVACLHRNAAELPPACLHAEPCLRLPVHDETCGRDYGSHVGAERARFHGGGGGQWAQHAHAHGGGGGGQCECTDECGDHLHDPVCQPCTGAGHEGGGGGGAAGGPTGGPLGLRAAVSAAPASPPCVHNPQCGLGRHWCRVSNACRAPFVTVAETRGCHGPYPGHAHCEGALVAWTAEHAPSDLPPAVLARIHAAHSPHTPGFYDGLAAEVHADLESFAWALVDGVPGAQEPARGRAQAPFFAFLGQLLAHPGGGGRAFNMTAIVERRKAAAIGHARKEVHRCEAQAAVAGDSGLCPHPLLAETDAAQSPVHPDSLTHIRQCFVARHVPSFVRAFLSHRFGAPEAAAAAAHAAALHPHAAAASRPAAAAAAAAAALPPPAPQFGGAGHLAPPPPPLSFRRMPALSHGGFVSFAPGHALPPHHTPQDAHRFAAGHTAAPATGGDSSWSWGWWLFVVVCGCSAAAAACCVCCPPAAAASSLPAPLAAAADALRRAFRQLFGGSEASSSYPSSFLGRLQAAAAGLPIFRHAITGRAWAGGGARGGEDGAPAAAPAPLFAGSSSSSSAGGGQQHLPSAAGDALWGGRAGGGGGPLAAAAAAPPDDSASAQVRRRPL